MDKKQVWNHVIWAVTIATGIVAGAYLQKGVDKIVSKGSSLLPLEVKKE